MQTNKIDFQYEGDVFEIFSARNMDSNRPAVMIVHDWSGKTEFFHEKAMRLAELGYVGVALDLFGKGKIGKTNEEKSALIQPLVEDRALLQKRLLACLAETKKIAGVDVNKIGAMGFCFGGLCVLDLARSGADIQGVVSFHGLLGAPANMQKKSITAKVLALHGHDDPMVPPEQVLAFETEMTTAHADWQVHVYGNTKHAFTNPLANDPGFGTVYNASAEKRSWIAMKNFFEEIFAE